MALKFSDVSFAYGSKEVLSHFSLELPENGVVCLSGPSGSGKTTLLRLAVGLLQPQAGSVAGQPQKPSFLFQEDRLLPWETACDNLRLITGDTATAEAWLRAVGLEDAAQLYPREMSGGMQRRLALARALALDSDMLLLDEPFTGIDRERIDALAPLVRDYASTKPVLLITHAEEDIALLGAAIYELSGSPVNACRIRK